MKVLQNQQDGCFSLTHVQNENFKVPSLGCLQLHLDVMFNSLILLIFPSELNNKGLFPCFGGKQKDELF